MAVAAATRGDRVTETYSNVANADDIARQWPDGRDMPTVIRSVVDYVKNKPWMSLGATRLVGDRMDDFWIENGADLWQDFGIFMRLPDGSRVAQWFQKRDAASVPPIVYIGSEGEMEILSSSLEAFLATWALAHFDVAGNLVGEGVKVGLPSDLIRDEDDADDEKVVDGRPPFAAFLTSLLGQDVRTHVRPKPDDAPFKAFFEAWGKRQRAALATNSNLTAIVRAMDAYVPRGKQPWERAHFHLAAIGDRLEIGGKGDPRKPLNDADAAAIRPFILAEREARASGEHAPRGLWHSASLLLYPDGACQIAADWSAAPKFWHGAPATAAELAADQSRFPKSPRWREPWMDELG